MSTYHYWRGETAIVKITDIAKDGSGIKSVLLNNCSGITGTTSSTYLTGTVVQPNGINPGSYTINFLINSASGSSSGSTSADVELYAYWEAGGASDNHGATIKALTPATKLNISDPKESYVWADSLSNAYWEVTSEGTGTMYYKNTPSVAYHNLYSDATGSTNLKDASGNSTILISRDNGIENRLIISINDNIDFGTTGKITAYAKGGTRGHLYSGSTSTSIEASDVDYPEIIAPTQLWTTVSKSITIKNPVDSINIVSGSSGTPTTEPIIIYTKVGAANSITYNVIPAYKGVSYSYDVSLTTSTSSTTAPSTNNVTTTNTKAVASGTNGIFTLTPKTTGTQQFYIYSKEASSRVNSPKITLYVSAADLDKYINAGDTISIDLGTTISEVKYSLVNNDGFNATKAAGMNSSYNNSTLTVSATSNVTAGDYKYQINGSTVVTIHVSHISVAWS